jgi:quercetin dioxygenase-like cupin family protein
MTTQAGTRFGIDAYLDWVEAEGLPVGTGLAIDLFALETRDWPRYGIRGAVAHCDGRGDYCNVFVYDIPAGKSTTPQHHIYEEVIYVLAGRGSTQLELTDGTKRSFEWCPRSLFAIPLNSKHRHFNASGTEHALLASTTNMPLVMKMFHNERFVFGDDFDFSDRVGKDQYYTGEGDLHMIRQGDNVWETNFVPDLSNLKLHDFSDRGAGGTSVNFVLADSSMHAHISEIPSGRYKKAHRHYISDTHVTCVAGTGYSLLWYEGERDFVRVDWKNGTVFPPHAMQFHQHFATSVEPARYLGSGLGSRRYPVTDARRRSTIGTKDNKRAAMTSVKQGGNQIEYEDQDPTIHPLWLAEMQRCGITPNMEQFIRS